MRGAHAWIGAPTAAPLPSAQGVDISASRRLSGIVLTLRGGNGPTLAAVHICRHRV